MRIEKELEILDTEKIMLEDMLKAMADSEANIASVIERYHQLDANEDDVIILLEEADRIQQAYRQTALSYYQRSIYLAEAFKQMKIKTPGITAVAASSDTDYSLKAAKTTCLENEPAVSEATQLRRADNIKGLAKDAAFISAVEEMLQLLGPESVDIIDEKEWISMLDKLCNIHDLEDKAASVGHVDRVNYWLSYLLDKYDAVASKERKSAEKKLLNKMFPDFFGTFFYPLTTLEKGGQINNPRNGSYPFLFNMLGMADYIACLERSRMKTCMPQRDAEDVEEEMLVHIYDIFENLAKDDSSAEIWRVRLEHLMDRICLPRTDAQKREDRYSILNIAATVMEDEYEPDSRADAVILDIFFNYAYKRGMEKDEFYRNMAGLKEMNRICRENFLPEKDSRNFYTHELSSYLRYLKMEKNILESKKQITYAQRLRLNRLDNMIAAEEDITKEAILAVSTLDIFTGILEGIRQQDEIKTNLKYLEDTVLPAMKDSSGNFQKDFKYPLFDAVHLASQHIIAYHARNEQGQKITYYADTLNNEVLIFHENERDPRQIYRGTFDSETYKIDGWLYQTWSAPRKVATFSFTLPDDKTIEIKHGDRIDITEYDRNLEPIKNVYLYKERNKEKLTITQEMVSLDEVPNRLVREIWVSLFNKEGKILSSEGWIADLNETKDALAATEGFEEPLLREKYMFTPYYKYTDEAGKEMTVTKMQGARYNILNGDYIFKQILYTKYQPDYNEEVLVESVIEDWTISDKHALLTIYKSRETDKKDEAGGVIIEIHEDKYIVSNPGSDNEIEKK